tara:strand:+ start:42116 stop:42430 length:315 start_codon:yes stop_codon:yes gene_type:complete
MRWGLRAAFIAAVVLVLSALPYQLIGGTGSGKLGAMHKELRRVEVEIAETSEELTARRRRVDALKNDTRTIETIARQELHMLYPHEKTLRLGDVESHKGSEKRQ